VGYSGTATSIECQASGSWTSPTGCSLVDCGAPTASTGYVVGSGSTTYGSAYTLSCATGYTGTPVPIVCGTDGNGPFWTVQVGCYLANCGSPAAQAGYDISTGSSEFGATRSTSCSTGYSGSGSSITCQTSGAWSSATGCTIVDCLTPTADTGYVVGTGGTTYLSTYTMSCSTGYYGPAQEISCLASGSWTSQTGCTIVSCASSPTQLGYTIGSGSSTYTSTRTTSCATGYSGSGSTITCEASGSWQLASGCTIVSCGNPSASTGYDISAGATTYQATRTVSCLPGYTGTAASITCQSSGSWTAQSGCTIRDCGTPTAGTGYVVGSGSTTYSAAFSLTCATGYYGTPTSITCQADGTWTTQSGCTIVNCGAPSLQTGYVINSSGGSTYQSTRTVTCASGYGGTSPSLTCQADGSWTSASGCAAGTCGTPGQTGYSYTSGSSDFGTVRTVACATGYTGTPNPLTTTCQSSLAWTTNTGCALLSCGTPTAVTGYAVGSGSTTYGSTHTMACATGYDGTAGSLTCQANGAWTSQTGCAIVSCGSPAAATGYDIGLGGTTYQATRGVACSVGYSGTATSIECQASGSWTTSTGCTILDCGTPTASTGYVVGSGSTTYGSAYTLSCDTGYLGLATSITCLSSGFWESQTGCRIVECGAPVLPPGYSVSGGGSSYAASRTVSCTSGYGGSPPDISCQAGGYWYSLSGCTVGDCGAPSQIGYAYSSGDTTFGIIRSVSCDIGYTGTASPLSTTCQSNRSWSVNSGCTLIDCGTPIALTGHSRWNSP